MVYAKMSALAAALSWPVRLLFRLLDWIVAVLNSGPAAGLPAPVPPASAVAPVLEATPEPERAP